ncbi:hypothetical protein MNBD_PLANCTO03-893, partial [hydrothermal vent metagenome]
MAEHTERSASSGRAVAAACAVVLVVYLLIASILIGSGSTRGRGAWDDVKYHEPTIRTFAEQWPALDLTDYLSATTPGYHIVLAAAAVWIDDSRLFLQVVGASFTIALYLVVTIWCARRLGAARAAACVLPMVGSMYVLFPGVWLLPDNAGWLGVVLILMLALRPRWDVRAFLAGSIVLAALVMTRQVHLWAAALLCAGAWLGRFGTGEQILDQFSRRLGRSATAVLAAVPAMAIVAWFALTWGGLTPPTFQGKVQKMNFAVPAFLLVQIAVLTPWFAGYLAEAASEAWRSARGWILGAAVLGLIVAAVPQTTYSTDLGRYSGYWNIVRSLPVLGGHTSILVLFLAPLGAMSLVVWCVALPRRERWVMAAGLGAFAAAQIMNANCWQRYHEPYLLICMALGAAMLGSAAQRRPPARLAALQIAGPVVL